MVGKKFTKALVTKPKSSHGKLHAYLEDRKAYIDTRTLYVWGTDY